VPFIYFSEKNIITVRNIGVLSKMTKEINSLNINHPGITFPLLYASAAEGFQDIALQGRSTMGNS
jgi:hypothetical protein